MTPSSQLLPFEWSALAFVSSLLVIALPIVIVAYYWLRLSLRQKALLDKLLELDLTAEFLRLFDYDRWIQFPTKNHAEQRELFLTAFNKQWRGDTRGVTYLPPLVLLIVTAAAFVSFVLIAWSNHQKYSDLMQYPVLFAIGGAIVYAYPRLVQRYGSLTLNPQAVYEILGILWISVLTGVIAAVLATDALKAAAAFCGSVLPVPTLLFIREKLQTKATPDEDAQAKERERLLDLIGGDLDLLTQLSYIGIRSVRVLAAENPIRLFAEVDPNLVLCLELVDRANLVQWVPDPVVRARLNALGPRTAVDLMTQGYEYLPTKQPSGETASEWRFLSPDEPLPGHLEAPFEAFRNALGLDSVSTYRNLLAMMSEEPQLLYLQSLWVRVGESVNRAFEVQNSSSDPVLRKAVSVPESAPGSNRVQDPARDLASV